MALSYGIARAVWIPEMPAAMHTLIPGRPPDTYRGGGYTPSGDLAPTVAAINMRLFNSKEDSRDHSARLGGGGTT